MKCELRVQHAFCALVVVSALLLGLRLWAASVVGFGDSEALYACYAAHGQAAYLDHPGLVGLVARLLGNGGVPSPWQVHRVTSFLATGFPWLVSLAARAGGARWSSSWAAGLVVAAVPETAVGLFALTPDLLLAYAAVGALACASLGVRAPLGSAQAAVGLVLAGLLAGLGTAAKVSGALVFAAVVVTVALPASRPHTRTVWPWVGLALGVAVVAPVVLYEIRMGAPMLHHRLVATQGDAGVSFRTLGQVVGGQLLYLSPVAALAAVLVARHLASGPRDAIGNLYFVAFALPLGPLLALSLWSRVAEPHWLAPALLVLPLHAARSGCLTRRLVWGAVSTSLGLVLLVHMWVLVPSFRRVLAEDTDLRADLSTELYGWPEALATLEGIVDEVKLEAGGEDPVVVGPHWVVCAQVEAGARHLRVGCATPNRDDFDDWMPREQWRQASTLVVVRDGRFEDDIGVWAPGHVAVRDVWLEVRRAGRLLRRFRYTVLHRAV